MQVQTLMLQWFEKDLQANLLWVKWIEEHEDALSPEIQRIFSQLINAHHIWNCRLRQLVPESDWHDVLNPLYFERLIQDNYQQSIAFIEHSESFVSTHYYEDQGSEQLAVDILMQVLLQNAGFRGQLELLVSGKDQLRKFDF